MHLLFARHGHPDYTTDSLTTLGHLEAARLAEALDPFTLDAIFISSMGRARETAEYTLRRRSQDGVVFDWLREIDGRYGYEGAEAPQWRPGDMLPSAYDMHPAHVFARPAVPSYEDWHAEVAYGPWLRPRFDALQQSFDALLAQEGYERDGLRYRVRAPSQRTLAFFCHDGVMRGMLSHLLYVPLPAALALLIHDTTGLTMLRSVEKDGYAVFRMVFINSVAHKQNGAAT